MQKIFFQRVSRIVALLHQKSVFMCVPLWMLLVLGGQATAQEPPREIPADEIDSQSATLEKIEGINPGVLLSPRSSKPGKDEKYGETYAAQIMVYAAERPAGILVRYVRRFRVYVPDASGLPFARNVAQSLLTLHSLTQAKLGYDHPRATPVVNVWLTRSTPKELSADTGGEQIRNDIYLYHFSEERKPIEWAREVAHEYGHFALPGISGFVAPEEWGNGVLGERLFLKWIDEGLTSKQLTPAAFPLASPEEIARYRETQITPLIRRVCTDGVTEKRMAIRNAAQMDTFVALALFWESVYGSRALRNAFTDTESGQKYAFSRADDFWRGAAHSLKGAEAFRLSPPDGWTEGKPFRVFLPAGEYTVKTGKKTRQWNVSEAIRTGDCIKIGSSGWHSVTFSAEAVLTRRRR